MPVRDHQVVPKAQGRGELGDERPVLDLLPAAVIVFDAQGAVSLINRRAKTLLESACLDLEGLLRMGLRGWVRLHPQWSPLLTVLSEGKEWRNPAFGLTIAGEPRLFDVIGKPVCQGSEIVAVMCTIWPLSAESTLQYLPGERERLATTTKLSAGAAHEIRNTLTLVRGFIQLMKLQQRPNPKHLRIAIAEIDRMEVLLQGLLLIARPSAPQRRRYQPNKLISEVLILIEARAKQLGIELETSLDPDLPMIEIDCDQIRQALFNLILNAKEAMGRGGRLCIQTRYLKDIGCIEIRVVDNGPGIPEDQVPQVLSPFYTTKSEGTGLGLPLVKCIVENHGGELILQSKVGSGTTATIRLPLDGVSKQ